MRIDDGDQSPTYRILDPKGRPIGRVRVPAGGAPLGRGAGTVLLIRDQCPRQGDSRPGPPTGCCG